METPYDIYGYIVIHSFEKAGFEILDIEIPEEYDTPQRKDLWKCFVKMSEIMEIFQNRYTKIYGKNHKQTRLTK